MKRLRYTIALLWLAAAGAVASDPTPDGKPVLKVAYGDYYGIAPLAYSYAVWPSGEIRYTAAASKDNAVKTRGTKMLRTTPEKVVRAVNRLLEAGFLSLRSEVHTFMATLQARGQISLDRTIATHSQELTLEFHFENEDHKIVVSRSESFPWITTPLKEIESEIGVRELVE
ncbi:MAG TPA: hypothetical protein VM940_08950 [Chthoniobacterales bacterium]|jgi:hypothetical protein|nr:hypothetical protein [Chthoniobacterales bacterium]